jgi:hypothetical protein
MAAALLNLIALLLVEQNSKTPSNKVAPDRQAMRDKLMPNSTLNDVIEQYRVATVTPAA